MKQPLSLDERIEQAQADYRNQPPAVPTTGATLTAHQVAQLIDHTLLKPDAVSAHLRQLCEEAKQYHFFSVCIQPNWTPFCLDILTGSEVKVCTVIGFPQGATLPAVKAFEAEQVLKLGVHEVDMVLNVGRLKDRDYRLVQEDVAVVADAAHEGGGLLKVIIETGLLTDDEKVAASVICQEAGADFVKTSTGFNGGGATAHDIAMMRHVVGPKMGVKASGGVRTAQDALLMVAAGATRIGTSSGLKIVQELLGLASDTGKSEGY